MQGQGHTGSGKGRVRDTQGRANARSGTHRGSERQGQGHTGAVKGKVRDTQGRGKGRFRDTQGQ